MNTPNVNDYEIINLIFIADKLTLLGAIFVWYYCGGQVNKITQKWQPLCAIDQYFYTKTSFVLIFKWKLESRNKIQKRIERNVKNVRVIFSMNLFLKFQTQFWASISRIRMNIAINEKSIWESKMVAKI